MLVIQLQVTAYEQLASSTAPLTVPSPCLVKQHSRPEAAYGGPQLSDQRANT
jgi:hypothetical protein